MDSMRADVPNQIEEELHPERTRELQEFYLRLANAHAALPHLRIGQLLDNAFESESLFYRPDADLVSGIEKYVAGRDGL